MLNLLIDDTYSLTSICTTRSSTNLHVSNYPFTSKYQTFPRSPSAFKPLHKNNCAINNTTGQNRTFAAIYLTQEHTLSEKIKLHLEPFNCPFFVALSEHTYIHNDVSKAFSLLKLHECMKQQSNQDNPIKTTPNPNALPM
jgi:hypothetical protein